MARRHRNLIGATLARMKLWDVSTKQETHRVARALTVVGAWELRDCPNEILGLDDRTHG